MVLKGALKEPFSSYDNCFLLVWGTISLYGMEKYYLESFYDADSAPQGIHSITLRDFLCFKGPVEFQSTGFLPPVIILRSRELFKKLKVETWTYKKRMCVYHEKLRIS